MHERKNEGENPALKALKEHLKQLREDFGGHFFESNFEDDDVDIDSMSYEELL